MRDSLGLKTDFYYWCRSFCSGNVRECFPRYFLEYFEPVYAKYITVFTDYTPGSMNSLFSDLFKEFGMGIVGAVWDYLGS